jgi:hypothetical protein
MVRFYDALKEPEFSVVIDLLKKHGIEFALTPRPQPDIGEKEILVAEEDVPFAEELVRQAREELRH